MIRVLLADDEVLSIRYIKKMIPWEELGYEIVGEAADGRQALELYEKTKPQIILSDIKMPVMDGVELSAALRQRDAGVKIILVSAYRDFEYAKRAIQYNVSNYLLKHELSTETLKKELESVRGQIEKEADGNRLAIEEQFKDVIYGKAVAESLFAEEKKYGNRYIMMTMRMRKPVNERGGAEAALAAGNQIWKDAMEAVKVLGTMQAEYVAGLNIDNENQMLLLGITTNSTKEVHDSVWSVCQCILRTISSRWDCDGNIIYSGVIGVEKMPEIFRALSYAIRYTMFMEREKSYSLNDVPVENPDRRLHLHEELVKLETFLETGEEGGCEVLESLFEKVMKPVWNLTEFRYLTRNLDAMLWRTAKKQGIQIAAMPQEYTTVKESHGYYQTGFLGLAKTMRQRQTATYSKAVREVLYYVHEHYHEEITLDTAGSLCGLNGVYLGQLFKKEVGISLAKYLTNYRCEQAKRMLTEGTYTVSQISEMVGYQTSQYFSQTFRKVTGMTPQEYKNGGSLT